METLSEAPFLFVLTVFLGGILVRLSWIDLKTLTLPDLYTLPLIVLGLGLSVVFPQPGFYARLIGAAAGFLILGVIGEVYFRRTGAEGLGLGDAKLFAAAGAWLGWQALPIVMLVAAVSGLAQATLRRRSHANASIAFGPMLALGFFLYWVKMNFFGANLTFSHF